MSIGTCSPKVRYPADYAVELAGGISPVTKPRRTGTAARGATRPATGRMLPPYGTDAAPGPRETYRRDKPANRDVRPGPPIAACTPHHGTDGPGRTIGTARPPIGALRDRQSAVQSSTPATTSRYRAPRFRSDSRIVPSAGRPAHGTHCLATATDRAGQFGRLPCRTRPFALSMKAAQITGFPPPLPAERRAEHHEKRHHPSTRTRITVIGRPVSAKGGVSLPARHRRPGGPPYPRLPARRAA